MGHPVQSKRLGEKSVERKRGVFGSVYVTAKAVTHKAHSATVAEKAPRVVAHRVRFLFPVLTRRAMLCRAYGACVDPDTSD